MCLPRRNPGLYGCVLGTDYNDPNGLEFLPGGVVERGPDGALTWISGSWQPCMKTMSATDNDARIAVL